MRLADRSKNLIKTIIAVSMLVALLATMTGCAELGFPAPTTPEETPAPEPEPEKVTSLKTMNTRDAAILSVYQDLLSQAESYEAKIYLSDFYASCDNWTAKSEYFKDGSDTWHVVVDMTAVENWQLRPYWQQASWFVYRDGKVIPSNLFQANALRIEADLQALSPRQEAEAE